MIVSSRRARPFRRIDWRSERERIDLAAVATDLLGRAPGRRGEGGRKLWWSCPFHQDNNPSFCVDPGKPRFRCFGCGANGDAANLVMQVRSCNFPEAIAYLTGGPIPPGRPRPPMPSTGPRATAKPESSGLSPEAAAALVADSAAHMWSPEGADAVAYLTGPRRCLAPETIAGARLGWAPLIELKTREGGTYTVSGIVVPWFAGGRLSLVKVRQPDGRRPKYAEVFRDRARHSGIYPCPEAIRAGRPLIVVEGEFDSLCLGQELGSFPCGDAGPCLHTNPLASGGKFGPTPVVTLGSASNRPTPEIFGLMLPASPWYIATDGDEAGEKSAGAWPAPSRRVRPPGSFKDWSEAKAGGVDLARWWRDVLSGFGTPPLFTWDELSRWCWGPALDDPSPGIDVLF